MSRKEFYLQNLYKNTLKASPVSGGALFAIDINKYTKASDFGVAIFDISSLNLLKKESFKDSECYGTVYSKVILDFDIDKNGYCFYFDDEFVTDTRADRYVNVAKYGEFPSAKYLIAVIEPGAFIKNNSLSNISFEDSLIYQLHIRGFTKNSNSKVSRKGYYAGAIEKLDYLRNLGITTIEVQPVNEFNECDSRTGRLNYWGYCEGYYYAPKQAYSFDKNSVKEFSDLVFAIHSKGMEIIQQFFFPPKMNQIEIVEILEYWHLKFHIDGFHILGENVPIALIAKSPILSDCKLMHDRLDGIEDANCNASFGRRIALYREDYLYTIRSFLKADEFTVEAAAGKIKNNPSSYATINFLDSFNTFTLNDMFTYERKHNEENGEDNRDGNDNNLSWNCGIEGTSRKRNIVNTRNKQIKNALTILMFSAGTPMIFMGDEFGRTQNGNNNPYCQDNEITWLDWSLLRKKSVQYEFFVKLVNLRNSIKLLHRNKELSMLDVCGCGFPEISFHGESAWKAQLDGHKHNLGVMYCDNGELYYLAINMHWDSEELSLPRSPKGYEWTNIASTGEDVLLDKDNKACIPERTIVIYKSVKTNMIGADRKSDSKSNANLEENLGEKSDFRSNAKSEEKLDRKSDSKLIAKLDSKSAHKEKAANNNVRNIDLRNIDG